MQAAAGTQQALACALEPEPPWSLDRGDRDLQAATLWPSQGPTSHPPNPVSTASRNGARQAAAGTQQALACSLELRQRVKPRTPGSMPRLWRRPPTIGPQRKGGGPLRANQPTKEADRPPSKPSKQATQPSPPPHANSRTANPHTHHHQPPANQATNQPPNQPTNQTNQPASQTAANQPTNQADTNQQPGAVRGRAG